MKLHFIEAGDWEGQESVPEEESYPGQVHIWILEQDHNDPFGAHARFVLSEAELEKAGRFHFENDSRVYKAGHVFMRRALSKYLGMEPGAIEFTPDTRHKPEIVNASDELNFNITHSKDLMILAVGFDIDVGIDTEYVDPDFDTDGFAENNFHPNEQAAFNALNGDAQNDYFYRIWTMKEAFLKLTGEGINDRLSDLDFSGKSKSFEYSGKAPDELWQHSLKIRDEYVCSLASNRKVGQIRFFQSSLIEPVVNEDI